MKVNVINNVPNIEVTLNQSSDGSTTLVVKEKMQNGNVNKCAVEIYPKFLKLL